MFRPHRLHKDRCRHLDPGDATPPGRGCAGPIPDGTAIPIEQRAAEELLTLGGQPVAAAGAAVWNPSFDVTPAELVDALVTERGVVLAPNAAKMARLMGSETHHQPHFDTAGD